jgi:hypothetical protein
MGRPKRAVFREIDLCRALRGARKAGMVVGRVEIDTSGKIVMVAGTAVNKPETELDRWRAKRARPA